MHVDSTLNYGQVLVLTATIECKEVPSVSNLKRKLGKQSTKVHEKLQVLKNIQNMSEVRMWLCQWRREFTGWRHPWGLVQLQVSGMKLMPTLKEETFKKWKRKKKKKNIWTEYGERRVDNFTKDSWRMQRVLSANHRVQIPGRVWTVFCKWRRLTSSTTWCKTLPGDDKFSTRDNYQQSKLLHRK